MRSLWRPLTALVSLLGLVACSSESTSHGGGVPPADDVPLPAEPEIGAEEYVVELERWGIYDDSSHAAETTEGLNQAIAWAVANGYARVRLPAGTYLVGTKQSDIYWGGLELESEMALVMDEGAVLQMAPTDTWNYCVVAVTAKHDVLITGGAIRGDRYSHVYTTGDGTGDDEGHCLCIQNESERVAVVDVELSEATGDGILIVAQGAEGSSCQDVTVRSCTSFDNRRQGVSIVGGVRVLIEQSELHHMEGTAPQFGIDIESLSYLSRDIVIRESSFHHNRGGDFVNCDGHNVLFDSNTLDEGEGSSNIDGPIVYWTNTDQIIRDNHITVVNGSVNGKVGVIAYSVGAEKQDATVTHVVGNTLVGAGMYMYESADLAITDNQIEQGYICLADMSNVALSGNSIDQDSPSWAFRFKNVSGSAAGNLLNGEPYEIPLTSVEPYTSDNWVE